MKPSLILIVTLISGLLFNKVSHANDDIDIEIGSSLSMLYQYQVTTRLISNNRPYYLLLSSDFIEIKNKTYYSATHFGAGRHFTHKLTTFGINVKLEIPVYYSGVAYGLDAIGAVRLINTPVYLYVKLEASYFKPQKSPLGSGASKTYFYNTQLGISYRF